MHKVLLIFFFQIVLVSIWMSQPPTKAINFPGKKPVIVFIKFSLAVGVTNYLQRSSLLPMELPNMLEMFLMYLLVEYEL